MTKTTLDVTDLFSVLDFAGVQKRLLALPGVGAVEMTAASSSVTVTYDSNRTDAAAIAAEIKACGFHCRGETVPKHLCLPDSAAVPPDTSVAPPGGGGGQRSTCRPCRDEHWRDGGDGRKPGRQNGRHGQGRDGT